MKTRFLFLGTLLFVLLSCGNPEEEAAWRVAEQSPTNRTELTRFLEHYQSAGDKEKYRAACFLVANMPGKYAWTEDGTRKVYDVDVVETDSLIRSLEYSFRLKAESPYLQGYTFRQFCEYVLPYRVAHEPLEYYWKWDCAQRFRTDSTDIVAAARHLNAQVRLGMSADFYGALQKSYSTLMREGYGKCDDRSTLVVMALRAAGIPAAFELVPYWGSSNNAHSFAALVLPNDSSVAFQNADNNSETGLLHRKTPKVYRKRYSRASGADAERLTLPELFRPQDLQDVTDKHRIGFRDVALAESSADAPLYLSVFSPNGWVPVAYSGDGTFPRMGTGRLPEGIEEAVGLGDGILYLPSRYVEGEMQPASAPVIVSEAGVRELRPDTTVRRSVTLERKFPLSVRMVGFANYMRHGLFQVANRPDFSDAKTVVRLTGTPLSRMQRVTVVDVAAYRYVRYLRPRGTFSMAEMRALSPEGEVLPFTPIACDAIGQTVTPLKVFDADPLTYLEINGGFDLWVGMDLGRRRRIGAIEFAPRNDDNAVSPGDRYELYYWDNHWVKVGEQQAEDYSLTFTGVPAHALLWLRDVTKGREERPFTYEDGRQVWW